MGIKDKGNKNYLVKLRHNVTATLYASIWLDVHLVQLHHCTDVSESCTLMEANVAKQTCVAISQTNERTSIRERLSRKMQCSEAIREFESESNQLARANKNPTYMFFFFWFCCHFAVSKMFDRFNTRLVRCWAGIMWFPTWYATLPM